MSEIIQTIDCDRWSEPDEQRRVKHLGMIKAKDAFEQLYTHLQAKNLLPDEYFLFTERNFPDDAELPDFRTAVCHTDFGGSEGIYIDVDLYCRDKQIHFATGKTLSEDADAFFRMSRIAAECSLMLNGRGSTFEKKSVEAVLTPEESLALGEVIDEKLCAHSEPDETEMYIRLMEKVYPQTTDNEPEAEQENEMEM